MALKTVRIAAELLSGSRARAPLSGPASLLGVLPGKGVGALVAAGAAVCVGAGAGAVAFVGVAVDVGLALGDGVAVGEAVPVGVVVAEGVAGAVGFGVRGVDGDADGNGPTAGADGSLGAGADGAGTVGADVSLGAGPVAPAPSDGAPSVPGVSGPHDGPMFGTGGGLSTVGSTAIGRVGAAGAGIDAGSVAGLAAVSPPAAGVSTPGEGAGVVLGSGAWKADGALPEGVVPPSGVFSVAGRSWLEPTMTNATVPATTMAAGAAHFPTITPRMLVAPKPRARL
jgi:hypothetical protein